jgi:small subunit ribosomal protein S12
MYAPGRKGAVIRIRIKTPKKPNSARRCVVKTLVSTRRFVVAHVPGKGHNLRRYSKIYLQGKGPKDLPGIHYTATRGVYDLDGCNSKTKRRSVYGVQLSLSLKTYVRKKLRK